MSEICCRTIQISHENFDTLDENTSDIKLFEIKLSSYYKLVPQLLNYLNEAELNRARKYHFEKDANQFIICRSLLKFVLAYHTGLAVTKILIKVDANKKPYVISNKNTCFNVSHAQDFAVIAISNQSVGIDLEYLNKNFDFSEILPTVFSDLEIKSILNADHKTRKFYNFWTRKEAIVKATGQGISDDLPLIPATDGNHLVASKILDGFKSLQLLSFDLNEDYIASLALSSNTINLDKIQIYNLPNSIEGLDSFCS